MAQWMRAAVLLCLLTVSRHAAALSGSLNLVVEDGSAAAVTPAGHMTTRQQLLKHLTEDTTSSRSAKPIPNNFKTEGTETQQQYGSQKPLLQDSRPYVIAHRGASGLLPEHTIPAYNTAIAQGADFIECDVVVTKDLQLICRHEPNLNTTTNAWLLFRDKAATYTIDGESVTGIFAADLTLQEVKQLRAKQRWAFRDQSLDGLFSIPTFEEFLDIALSANRPVGVYPEVKHPTWHNSLPQMHAAATSIEQLVVDALHDRGYASSAPVGSLEWRVQPVFIQSFEPTSLQKLATITDVPLVLLMGGWAGYVAPDTGMTHEQMVSEDFLAQLSKYANGVGPWKSSLYEVVESSGSSSAAAAALGCKSIHCSNLMHPDIGRTGSDSSSSSSADSSVATQLRLQSTGLVAKLQSYGFQVHPYTLRDEAQFVLEGCAGDVACEFGWLFDTEGVDGGFADYPGTLQEWLTHRQHQEQGATAVG